jgi:3-methyl-2-oxobutanoate hydroxymethyltransferase
MSYLQGEKPITISKLLSMHAEQEKIAVLTAYDSTMAALLNRCEIDVILVGDSLGNVVQGHNSTTPVTVEEMAYHTQCVARANAKAFLMADLPFASYGDPYLALESAAELMRAGADMVKLEGGGDWQVEIIAHLVERSVPVCAHLGLLPQSVHLLGGYKVQGKNKDAAVVMLEQAQACAAAGAQLLVLEAIPSALGKKITEEIREEPYLMIELFFRITDKEFKTVPFFLNEVQQDFMDKHFTVDYLKQKKRRNEAQNTSLDS